MNLYPVILAGGSGTRLWPMSRESHPKQYLALLEGQSPFQRTLARLPALGRVKPATVIASHEHRFLAADQAREAKAAIRALYLEPCARGTAPAIAIAAIDLAAEDPEAVMLVLPADHDIPDEGPFAEAVDAGLGAVAQGHLVAFGIEPRWAETGYGYIERGEDITAAPGCFRVATFVEKPELEIAQRLSTSGRHSWNSGMFLFRARDFIEELGRFEPELLADCRAAAHAAVPDMAGRLLDEAAFARCKSISVDHAVMEHTRRAAVVPAKFRWSDIGSWDALWDRADHDEAGNTCQGDVQLHDVSGSYLHSSHRLVIGIGLEDTVVIETPDAILVARRGETQRVREAVDRLKSEHRKEAREHRVVHRPWGHYEDIDQGDRFRVKRITVAPGGKLSLQMHHHRAEHWIVVRGTARVTCGSEVKLLTENQSVYVDIGTTHRLENPGKVPLQLIEVQTGCYLGEDDIVRFDDAYSRETQGLEAKG